MRRATIIDSNCNLTQKFLSTLSLRRATLVPHQQKCRDHFYPRSPCGERRQHSEPDSSRVGFLSTLSLRRATLWAHQRYFPADISIHALLAESDLRVLDGSKSSIEISIHALLAESDQQPRPTRPCKKLFLSTLSLRRATAFDVLAVSALLISIHALLAESDVAPLLATGGPRYFYPRSPCGERLLGRAAVV